MMGVYILLGGIALFAVLITMLSRPGRRRQTQKREQ